MLATVLFIPTQLSHATAPAYLRVVGFSMNHKTHFSLILCQANNFFPKSSQTLYKRTTPATHLSYYLSPCFDQQSTNHTQQTLLSKRLFLANTFTSSIISLLSTFTRVITYLQPLSHFHKILIPRSSTQCTSDQGSSLTTSVNMIGMMLLALIVHFLCDPTATYWLLVFYLIYYDVRGIRSWLVRLTLTYMHAGE